MPFPMPGEPQHPTAETPVARAARHDDAIELRGAHLGADRGVTARVFFCRELLVDRVTIVRRATHHVEGLVLVEAVLELVPGQRLRAGWGVHVIFQSLQLPIVCRPPSFSTASLASFISAICSKVSFFSGSRSPTLMLFWCVHSVR